MCHIEVILLVFDQLLLRPLWVLMAQDDWLSLTFHLITRRFSSFKDMLHVKFPIFILLVLCLLLELRQFPSFFVSFTLSKLPMRYIELFTIENVRWGQFISFTVVNLAQFLLSVLFDLLCLSIKECKLFRI